MSDLPQTNKSLGQHWLTDPASLQAICDAADIQPTDTVLEIGPGVGTLTSYLVRKAHAVVAVEFDQQLARDLPKNVPAANLTVVNQDILRFDLTTLPAGYKVVANIPYYLTSHLFRILSESKNPPTTAVLLVQKEVAQRVCAAPGSTSLLSVTSQFYWQVKLGDLVPAHLFIPPPKVDSQIVIMQWRDKPLFDDVEPSKYFRVVKAGFANRRKTVVNSLSAGLHLSKAEVQSLLQQANIVQTARAQELSLEDWRNLYKVLQP